MAVELAEIRTASFVHPHAKMHVLNIGKLKVNGRKTR